MTRRSGARRDHNRIHLEREDLIRLPTLSDELIQKINSRRDFVGEELAEVDRQVYAVVKALREAGCDKYDARTRHCKTHEAEYAGIDDGEICPDESS